MNELSEFKEWGLSSPPADVWRCRVCGETKPLTKEFWFTDIRPGRKWKYHACRKCVNVAQRESGREYARQRRSTEEGRSALRESIKKWKARNPDKVREQHRIENKRKAALAGREYRPQGRKGGKEQIERAYDRVIERNAYDAFDWWFSKKTNEEAALWWERTGKPWMNPRLTESQKWSVRYRDDLEFNASEKARLYAKKMRRKHGIAITDDRTASATLLIDARSCLYCGAKFDDRCKPTIDHLIPLIRGGTHSAANLVVCCLPCNSRKGKRDFLEFVQTLPDLYRARSLRAWRKLRGAPPQQQTLIQ